MATSVEGGTLAELWRFPVKSMQGERLDEAEVTELGLVGDRAYALVETDTGKVVSAKSVRRFPDLLNCRADFVEPPRPGLDPPPVRITLPNGTSATSDSGEIDQALSGHFGTEVSLALASPEDFTIDQYHPDVEGADPAGHRDTTVDQKLGSALFAELGLDSPVPVGAFFDMFPMSVMTTSTLDRLRELQPESRIDARRFRMNVIVETDGAGFRENDWIGRALALGDATRLQVALPDPRCVMTTLSQDDLPRDTDILRTLAKHNRMEIGPGAGYPCAGVYAAVAAPGTLRVGDRVSLA